MGTTRESGRQHGAFCGRCLNEISKKGRNCAHCHAELFGAAALFNIVRGPRPSQMFRNLFADRQQSSA